MRRPFVPFFVIWYCHDVVLDVVKRCELPLRDARVIEAGCGGGSALFRICRHARQITGLDISQATIDLLQQHYVPHYDNIDVAACDFADYEPRERVDLVFSNDCFEHVERPDEFLAAAARSLKPEGALCLQFPNHLDHGINHHRTLGELRRRMSAHFAAVRYFEVIPSGYHEMLHGVFRRLRARASAQHEKVRREVLEDPRTQGLDDFERSACYMWMRGEVNGGLRFRLARAINGGFRVLDRLGPSHTLRELTDEPDDLSLLDRRLIVVGRQPVVMAPSVTA